MAWSCLFDDCTGVTAQAGTRCRERGYSESGLAEMRLEQQFVAQTRAGPDRVSDPDPDWLSSAGLLAHAAVHGAAVLAAVAALIGAAGGAAGFLQLRGLGEGGNGEDNCD